MATITGTYVDNAKTIRRGNWDRVVFTPVSFAASGAEVEGEPVFAMISDAGTISVSLTSGSYRVSHDWLTDWVVPAGWSGVRYVQVDRDADMSVLTPYVTPDDLRRGVDAAGTAAALAAAPSGIARLSMVGDSNSANGQALAYWRAGIPGLIDGRSILAWAVMASQARLIYAGSYGVGGATTSQVRATQVPELLAASPRPDVCAIITGTNDTSALTTNAALASWAATYEGICRDLADAGVTPVLTTVLPRSTWAGGDIRNLSRQNLAIKRIAAANSWPLADLHAATASTTGSVWASGMGLDELHVSQRGARACGQAIAAALATLPTLAPSPLITSQAAAGGQDINAVSNGLMLVDTNADGLPDAWSRIGTNDTVTNPTDLAAVPIGKALRVVRGAADGQTYVALPTAIGQRYLFALRISSTVEASGGSARLRMINGDFATNVCTLDGWSVDIPAGYAFAAEFVLPSASPFDGRATAASTNLIVVPTGAAGAQMTIGQVTHVNLTTTGLA